MVLRSILFRPLTNSYSHFRLSCSSFHFSPLSETSFRRRFSSTPVVRAAAAASRSRRQRQAKLPPRPDLQSDVVEGSESETETETETEVSKSRSQLKREARRSVRWGMDLASFTIPQIKRILSVASLENDVYDAITVAKKLGPDVREGKRRQYNYIGKLLRSADPELLDTLIRATKDGDHTTLKALAGSNTAVEESDGDFEESDSDDEVEEHHIDMATRWLEGLIGKDAEITKEIYSLRDVDFDRQELRKLVRRVSSSQEAHEKAAEDNKKETEATIMRATKSLTRFLRKLAKQLPYEI